MQLQLLTRTTVAPEYKVHEPHVRSLQGAGHLPMRLTATYHSDLLKLAVGQQRLVYPLSIACQCQVELCTLLVPVSAALKLPCASELVLQASGDAHCWFWSPRYACSAAPATVASTEASCAAAALTLSPPWLLETSSLSSDALGSQPLQPAHGLVAQAAHRLTGLICLHLQDSTKQ